MKVELIHFTPIEPLMEAVAMPYQSKPTERLVARVWESGHRSIARHSVAIFKVEGISQSLLRQLSRHPHINLTVKSSRYCDMSDVGLSVPPFVRPQDLAEYAADLDSAMEVYRKWSLKDTYTKDEQREIAKMLLPLASQTDVIISGNYQALYEFLQLRLCTRAEWEIRSMAITMAMLIGDKVPAIFGELGCKGKEYGYCPESKGCGRFPSRD